MIELYIIDFYSPDDVPQETKGAVARLYKIRKEEQLRKEGLSESEIVERRFGPLMDDDIHWE